MAKYLGKAGLSGLLGYLVYVIVLIPVIIAALNVTGLTFLAAPMSAMLNQILLAIPKLFIAAAVLAIAFLIGRVLADVVTTLLANGGFDGLVARLSMGQVSETPGTSPSKLVGWLVLALVMLLGALARSKHGRLDRDGADPGGFRRVPGPAGSRVDRPGGRHLPRQPGVEGDPEYGADAKAHPGAAGARIAILVFAVAMALDQIGVANDIVNMSFGLILAGMALAVALAFGLGGQDVAKYQLVRMYKAAEATLSNPAEAPRDPCPARPARAARAPPRI